MTIDTVPPAAPSALVLDPATDSGVKGDDITNIARPQINGQGIAGDTVTLYDGATIVGSGGVNSAGSWQIVSSSLANGTHNLTATQTDAAGNASVASAPLSLAIDTIPPVAPSGLALDSSTDSGVKGDGSTNVARPEIDGHGAAGDTITLYDGTTLIGSGIVGGTGDWQIITSALPFGANALSATETDAAGNVSASSAVLPLNILKPSVPADLYGTGLSDLVFQNANTGQIEGWELNGTSVIANGVIGTPSGSGWKVAASSDLNGDGRADLILQNAGTGQIVGWEMNGTSIIASGAIGMPSDSSWTLVGAGDLNGDGHTDLLLQNAGTGQVQDWETSGTNVIHSADIGTPSDAGWKLAGIADLNGDGCSDLIFQNAASGEVWAWEMNGTSVIAGADIGTPSDASWKLAAVGSLRGRAHRPDFSKRQQRPGLGLGNERHFGHRRRRHRNAQQPELEVDGPRQPEQQRTPRACVSECERRAGLGLGDERDLHRRRRQHWLARLRLASHHRVSEGTPVG